ncbi:MAG TPA: ABC transporter substrate-binding protein [Thermoanaerobaculia bacterium]|jgi:NitT/TauT family transport system substrate-binding protein|nr:ABC transporter substrate-binding protein [Thermoanaerobaculia bacterium]
MPKRPLASVFLGLCLVALSLTCAKTKEVSTTTAAGTAGPAPRELRIGYLPIAECAHLYVGIAKKFFQEEQLTVKLQPMKGGATILPAVQSGDLDVGFTNVVSLAMFDSRLRPDDPHYLKSVCCASYERPNYLNHALLVAKTSRLAPSDLVKPSTRIGLNTILNIEELMLRRYLASRGTAAANLNVRQVAFPEMLNLLRNNDLDVISTVEPFIEPNVRKGDVRILARQYIDVSPETLVATYAVSTEWARENADVLARFYRAMAKADTFIRSNSAETRQIIGTFTRIQPQDLAVMGMPAFELTVNPARLQETVEQMRRFQFISQSPSVDSMIWKP